MRIHVVTPIVTTGFRPPEDLEALTRPDVDLTHSYIAEGPASIESDVDDVLAAPATLSGVIQAYHDGADAAVIDCFGDIALAACREAVPIPVVGPGEASLHLAAMLGHRISIIAVLQRVVRRIENRSKVYGLAERIASVRSVESPVLELETDRNELVSRLIRESEAAVREDGAHVIILGCTGMSHAARAVAETLAAHGRRVPVLEPLAAAVATAEALVRLGLTSSEISYPAPPRKRIAGYAELDQLMHEPATAKAT